MTCFPAPISSPAMKGCVLLSPLVFLGAKMASVYSPEKKLDVSHGSYNLEKALNFSNRLEKSLNLV